MYYYFLLFSMMIIIIFKVQITAADLAKAPLAASCTCPLKTRPPSRPHRHGLHRETSSRLATALFVLR